MSNLNFDIKKYNLIEKQKFLNNIRHEIKKRRLFFDEGKDKFGMDEMSQLIKVKNTSQVKGYPFVITKKNYRDEKFKMGIKIVPIETKYEKSEHPCNLENLILKELTENIVNKGISPHITHYLGTQKVTNKNKALKILNLKKLEIEGKIRSHSNMLISEFVEGGSLDNWIYNTYENDEEITDYQWKSIVFQLIYTIAVLQKYYKLMHNDFHYGNILIDTSIKPKGYFVYEINNKKYYLKNTGIIPKLWDWEFGMVYSDNMPGTYPNKFIIVPYKYDYNSHKTIVESDKYSELTDDGNVPYNYNEYYDLHYFLTSLLDLYISQELFDWIMKIYPEEVIPDEESSSLSSSSENTYSSTNSTNSKTSISSNESVTMSSILSDITSTQLSSFSETSISPSSSFSELNESSTEENYLYEGRLLNGVENIFKLPTVKDLLIDDFFKDFTIKPDDFKEEEAIYFKSNIVF